MLQNRFSNVPIINIERDLIEEEITVNDVMEIFQRNRKLKFI